MEQNYLGTILFFVAVLHTFMAQVFLKISHHFEEGSFRRAFFHLMGEIEVVFGFWGAIFLTLSAILFGTHETLQYVEGLNITEPLFVFVIMVMASTRPVLNWTQSVFILVSRVLVFLLSVFKVSPQVIELWVVLVIGSLAGSFITEPAAMTVTALVLYKMIKINNEKLMYALLAVLFVNISIGGALTPFAAPPILMVAQKWGWNFDFIITHFGWRSAIAVMLNSTLLVAIFYNKIKAGCYSLQALNQQEDRQNIPVAVILLHLTLLLLVILTAHYKNVFLGLFLLFLGVTEATKKYHDKLRIKESLLVAFFLAGIIVFGSFQKWWLQPLLAGLSEDLLFFISVALTAVTDNAALTYLGSQVSGLSDAAKFYLVAGALSGGGLTIIANAPNAAGASILSSLFKVGISPVKLLLYALPPTIVAIIAFYII